MKNFGLLIVVFIVSRAISYFSGVRFGFEALADYWQYLDVYSLRFNLLHSIWYQCAQPPLFNIFLGCLLKAGGGDAPMVFQVSLMILSIVNAVLLESIIRTLTANAKLSLIISSLYLIAPATLLLENELFYTTFNSCLLLTAVFMLLRLTRKASFLNAFLFFLSLALVCLTKSFYHLAWMALVALLVMIKLFPTVSIKKTALAALLPVCIVAGWYGKNYLLFGTFSASSWTGMNLARLVYHEKIISDTSSIASVTPFSPVSSYAKFLDLVKHTQGFGNERVLKNEFKNEGKHINMFNENYLGISRLYLKVSREEILSNPGDYLNNVLKAGLIFFTPASSYFKVEENERKINYYDAITTLNFSSFFADKPARKRSLAVSSVPMMLLYAFVLFIFFRRSNYPGLLHPVEMFIVITIIYSLLISSFFEYGDNMRFRYEIQPLFLILCAQYFKSFSGLKKCI
ncbi:MAG: hypothetical protein ABI151_09325 [Chitinophagaceae bacterium]